MVNKDMATITKIGPLTRQKDFRREIKAKDQTKKVAKEARASAKARDRVGDVEIQTTNYVNALKVARSGTRRNGCMK